jgi:hypothetical protein
MPAHEDAIPCDGACLDQLKVDTVGHLSKSGRAAAEQDRVKAEADLVD